jgi:hypothetical protein
MGSSAPICCVCHGRGLQVAHDDIEAVECVVVHILRAQVSSSCRRRRGGPSPTCTYWAGEQLPVKKSTMRAPLDRRLGRLVA